MEIQAMKFRAVGIAGLLVGCLLLLSCWADVKGQENLKTRFVSIEGLSKTYGSCSLVKFSVRNISQQGIDVEIYPENLKSGSWEEVDCQYDINHPKSEYFKLLTKNRKLLDPGASIALTYDRCSAYERCARAAFGENDKRSFRRSLEQEDVKAKVDVLQRFRFVIHVREKGHLTPAGKEWSDPFTRVSDGK